MEPWFARYECDPKNASVARHEVVRYARRYLSADDSADVEFAVGEALAAAVVRCASDESVVEVICEHVGPSLVVEVTDAAGTFDLGDLEAHADAPPAAIGYSIMIMHELMDEVEYPDRGRSVRLIRRRL